MRDILVTLIVFGSLPVILRRPWIGILVFAWISYMNPHRLTWGFAYDFNFAEIVAIVTIIGFVISREPKHFPFTPVTWLLIVLVFWVSFTTIFALDPDDAVDKWTKFFKIQLITFLTLFMFQSKQRILWLVIVMAASIAFFGVKGGFFVGVTGGGYRVWGPPKSFMADNNQLALALIMVMPLLWFLREQATRFWVRWGLVLATVLTLAAILGTHSRGALLALAAMLLVFWFRSRRKFMLATAGVGALVALLAFMPENWYERMESIGNYEEDSSAQGRFDAWILSLRVAADRPIVGGGFLMHESSDVYERYHPDAARWGRASHSIYFEVLGEHGWIGLTIFFLLGLTTMLTCQRIRSVSRPHPQLRWAFDLASMTQVSIIGYAAAGTFLNLATFDFFYHLVCVVVLTRLVVDRTLAEERDAHLAPDEAVADRRAKPSDPPRYPARVPHY